tara:strand:- start:6030 stop:6146 length:117 start_codon:yes stop_codon:yes gene_type:complete
MYNELRIKLDENTISIPIDVYNDKNSEYQKMIDKQSKN